MTDAQASSDSGRRNSLKHYQSVATSGAVNVVDKAASHLGKYNPLQRGVKGKDASVWLLDNTAYRPSEDEPWQADFITAFFVKGSSRDFSKAVAQVSEAIGLAKGDEARKTVAQRLQPLLNQIMPGRSVDVVVGDKAVAEPPTVDLDSSAEANKTTPGSPKVKTLGPSGPSGISRDKVIMPHNDYQDGEVLSSTITRPIDSMAAHTTFAGATGWAIISDIDDTIKKTLTSSITGILRTTFAEEPEPIAGMPEFYWWMNKELSNPPFWYLSASPYNLYPFLHEFRDRHYPRGTMLLKDASWMHLTGFLASIGRGTKEFKVDHIKRIQKQFPKRKLVCLGDSTQSDPEAYGDVCRAFPGWIKKVFIRKVTDVVEIKDAAPGQGEKERNAPERFEKAFEGVPKDTWHIFEDPKELYSILEQLTEADKEAGGAPS